jgi:hypothetical protein
MCSLSSSRLSAVVFLASARSALLRQEESELGEDSLRIYDQGLELNRPRGSGGWLYLIFDSRFVRFLTLVEDWAD